MDRFSFLTYTQFFIFSLKYKGEKCEIFIFYLLVLTDFMSTEDYLVMFGVREYLYFLFVYFSYCWKELFGSGCVEVYFLSVDM